MGIFDTLKIISMSHEHKVQLAKKRNASEDMLTKLCEYGNAKVLEAAAANPNTPKEALVEKLIEVITDRKRDIRESAIGVIKKLRRKKRINVELSLRLTQLLRDSDWIRSSEIVQALGVLGSRACTSTICSLIHIALREADAFESPRFEFSEDDYKIKQWIIKTDTDEGQVVVGKVYRRFIFNSIKALGAIGDPDAVVDLQSLGRSEYVKDHQLRAVVDGALEKIRGGKNSGAQKKIQDK